MTDLEFGPVELVLAAFEGDRPKAGVLDAILDLADAGTVRLLDLVYVTRSDDGRDRLDRARRGGHRDRRDRPRRHGHRVARGPRRAQRPAPLGTSALLLVVELTWAKHLASRLFEADGSVVDSVRIPAPVVNAVVEEARAAGALTD